MKRIYLLATTAAMLASCSSNEEFFLEEFNQGTPIEFGTRTANATRANSTGATAAALLSNQFIVNGQKTVSGQTSLIFNNVAVNYDGDNSVWDYVSGTEAVRYWDKTATSYDFYAFSDANGTSIVSAKSTGIFDGIDIASSTADKLAKVYVAPKVIVPAASFNQKVNFVFKNAAAKVRVGCYNGMSDYEVKINSFYTDNGSTEGLAGNYTALQGTFFSAAAYSVTAAGTQSKTDATADLKNIVLGNNIKSVGNLGKSRADATLEDYVWVLPTGTDAQDVKVKIGYTMTNTATSETITNTAEVVLPLANFQWEPNYAYTYILKITNSLTPIEFSAEVEEFTEVENGEYVITL